MVIVSNRLEKSLFCKINPCHQRKIALTQAEFNSFFEESDCHKRLSDEQIEQLSPEEMKILLRRERNLNNQYKNYTKELESELYKSQQKSFLLEEQTINIKHKLFGKSFEKSDIKSPIKKVIKDLAIEYYFQVSVIQTYDVIEKRVK